MKKLYIVFALFAAALVFSSSRTDYVEGCGDGISRKSAGPPSCYAGEPPLFTTCGSSGCHDDSPINSGTAQLHLDLGGADVNYIPGQQYTVTVLLSRTGIVRGGFQIVALQDSLPSKSPGFITLLEPVRTQRIDAAHPHPGPCSTQNKVWIEHTDTGIDSVANDTIQWRFSWLAPSVDEGSITFYLAAIDANKDLDNTGDYVYTLSKTISALSTSIKETDKDVVSVFPNPASDYIRLQNLKGEQRISIVSSTGMVVKEAFVSGYAVIDVSELACGVYFITNTTNQRIGSFVKR